MRFLVEIYIRNFIIHFHERFLCSDNEHLTGKICRTYCHEIVTTARDLELEVDDIEELITEHENDLTTDELRELLDEERQETQRDVSFPLIKRKTKEQLPTSAIF